MIINEESYDILNISLEQEKSDPDYGSCLWCRVTLDLTNYTLSIHSDCGDYSYCGWLPTPETESFLELLSRMDKSYLLSKISAETCCNIQQSIRRTCENVREYIEHNSEEDPIPSIECIEESISELSEELSNSELFYYRCQGILDSYNIHDSFEIIELVMDYPSRAKRIADIFEQHIQPYIKQRLND